VVGPHETRSGTTSFLSKYAANDGSGSPSFDGWSWPIIQSQDIYTSPKHVFDLIVKEQANAQTINVIIDGIRTAWNESKHGVFIGSLDFDKVGLNPYSGYDAVESLVRVVDEVGISPEDVTVIVTYRTPRINQWSSVWRNHFDAQSYQDFVCSDVQSSKRWEWLDTSMNPFKLAKAYHDQQWNVGVVDQDSILKAGKDVANTIACLAMQNENCEDGWVVGIEKQDPQILTDDEIDMVEEDRSDLEKLFLFRDCYYLAQVNHSTRFGIFAEDLGFNAIHRDCKPSKEVSYAPLSDTDLLLNAIQSQKNCGKDDIDVQSFLNQMSAETIDEWEAETVSFGDVSNDEAGDEESGGEGFDDEAGDNASENDIFDDEADDVQSDIDLVDEEAIGGIGDATNDEESTNDIIDDAEGDGPFDDVADDDQFDHDLIDDNADDEVSGENLVDNEANDGQSDNDLIGDGVDDGHSEIDLIGNATNEVDNQEAINDDADGDGDDESLSKENDDDDIIDDSSNKKLIVFVGPHETDATDVTKFFVNYASANGVYEPFESFNGWSWPLIEDDLIEKPAHHVFDYLVTDPGREDIQNVVIEGIIDTWDNSTKGVIIGSLNFDAVGANPYSDYDPVGVLYRLEDELGLSSEDVTVVVNYRSPRIDHWSAIWYNHFVSDDYEDFICSNDEQSNKRWEWLDVVMNPFKIAHIYHDQGWNVAVIDQESAIIAGTDTSHVIACNLMEGVNCTNGLIHGLEDVVSGYEDVIPMNLITEDDRRELEQLFHERDCYYKYELKDKPGFSILNQRSAWSTCSSQHKAYYKQFTDTDFMLYVLKSQQQCLTDSIDVPYMLEKKVVHDDDKKMIIFAGPHETAGISVTRFFAEHASEEEDIDTSLTGWTWPKIHSQIIGETASHRTFDLLLSDADNRPVQNIVMDGIRDSWNDADHGVVIGSLAFDRVGKNPYTNYDALGAIDRVVDTLGLSENDVTIVLNYRSKRIDHLSAVWWNHFEAGTLRDFTCSDGQADERWEWIDTVMNPLKLANAYVNEGWNVTIVEQEGTLIAGKDVSHTIACNLMNGVDCVDGWVRGLRSETTSVPNTYDIDDLDSIQRIALEKLFRMRDCFHKDKLESDNKFSTVNRKELWKSCSLKDKKKYEKLADTDFLLGVMRSLQGCGDGSNLESAVFASELQRSVRAGSHITVIIATVFISFIVIILIALKMKQRKKNKIRKAILSPPEGLFRDDPPDVDSRKSSYRDKVVVGESMEEIDFESDNESGEHESSDMEQDEEVGNDEEIDVDALRSNKCIIS